MSAGLRSGQVAEAAGVNIQTLRYYERRGLLAEPERSNGGHRLYGEDAVDRLAFIGAAKHLGLPLEEIAELLGVWQARACQEVKADLRERVVARIEEAERRAAELAAFTASLHRAVEHLDELPDREDRCNPQCAFLGRIPAMPPAPSAHPDGTGRRSVPTA
ncbi:hypothetical protein GCM10010420_34100 [Streptomyces glaucosporus]|uniref:HTH merR-type domain-containing protein n=1 Tax=Streptomyces glaucosporus TaxID=284044 RepID=A0ABP5VI30_9ACTN